MQIDSNSIGGTSGGWGGGGGVGWITKWKNKTQQDDV